MRLKSILSVLFQVCFLLGCTNVFAENVRRYHSEEIENLYQSSRHYFDIGSYTMAGKILKSLDPHQYPQVLNHLDAIHILSGWAWGDIGDKLEALQNAGVPEDSLYSALCEYALEKHLYEVYSFCANKNTRFVEKVDEQINRMLENYYNNRQQPFHTFPFLSRLVNQEELNFELPEDVNLIRERIGAVIENSACKLNGDGCKFPASAITSTIRAFVYE